MIDISDVRSILDIAKENNRMISRARDLAIELYQEKWDNMSKQEQSDAIDKSFINILRDF
jgi:hypothetical protein